MSNLNRNRRLGYTESDFVSRTVIDSDLQSVNSTIADFSSCQKSYWQYEKIKHIYLLEVRKKLLLL